MKSVIYTLILMQFAMTLSAGEKYYYSDSKRLPLYDHSSKVVVLSSKSESQEESPFYPMEILDRFTSGIYDVSVVLKSDSTSINDVKKVFSSRQKNATVYPCYLNENGEDVIPTSYLYVELKSAGDYNKLQRIAAMYGCQICGQNRFMPLWYTLQISADSDRDAVNIANRMQETGLFKNVNPSFATTLSVSYDPYVYQQWGLYNSEYDDIDISVSEAWNYATGHGVKVAVIDNGVESTHIDLAANMSSKTYDAASASSPGVVYRNYGTIGHGTHCAGIIGAVRNNGIGISGVSPDAEIMSVSVDFQNGNSIEQLADAINWACQNGADILSCSWNCPVESSIIKQAIDNAITNGRNGKGCVIVCSSGNASSGVEFPANYREEVIAVGNIQKDGIFNFFSCIGDELFICAPGTNILSTMLDDTFSELSGTSMACPHVSGVVALVLELNPDLSVEDILKILAESTDKVGHLSYSTKKSYGSWNEVYGYGLVNATKAVTNAIQY